MFTWVLILSYINILPVQLYNKYFYVCLILTIDSHIFTAKVSVLYMKNLSMEHFLKSHTQYAAPSPKPLCPGSVHSSRALLKWLHTDELRI